MRVSQDEKDRSHARIVAAAARIVREQGIEGASVTEVMSEAGLTHGGFYRHFADKDALADEAIAFAFGQILAALRSRFEENDPATAAMDFQKYYLSEGHVANPGMGCPVAALAGEIGRGGTALKKTFGAGVGRLIRQFAAGMPGSDAARRAKATREVAMMAGAVMIARASDPDTAREVLLACRPSERRGPRSGDGSAQA